MAELTDKEKLLRTFTIMLSPVTDLKETLIYKQTKWIKVFVMLMLKNT